MSYCDLAHETERFHTRLRVIPNGVNFEAIRSQMLGAKRPRTEPDVWLTQKETQIINTIKEVIEKYQLDVTPRIAGGWVRDKILGLASDDMDFALDTMVGEELASYVQNYLSLNGTQISSVGVIRSNPAQSKHLNTATFRLHGSPIDMNNLRTEFYDTDSRIPIATIGTTRDDALRRDFTANSMYYNIMSGKIEDIVGTGLSDLQEGILRTPLPAFKTFNDDPLRVLRCARFAGRFGFQVTMEIERAASHPSVHRNLLTKVSRERYGLETKKMFHEFGRIPAAMSLISRWGLRTVVFEYPAQILGPTAFEINAGTSQLFAQVRPTGQIKKPKLTAAQQAEQNAARCPNVFLQARYARRYPYFPMLDTQYLVIDDLLNGSRGVSNHVNMNSPYALSLTTSSLMRKEDPIASQLCWTLLNAAHHRVFTRYPHRRPTRLTKEDVMRDAEKRDHSETMANNETKDGVTTLLGAESKHSREVEAEGITATPLTNLRNCLAQYLDVLVTDSTPSSVKRVLSSLTSPQNPAENCFPDFVNNAMVDLNMDALATFIDATLEACSQDTVVAKSPALQKLSHALETNAAKQAMLNDPSLDDVAVAMLGVYLTPFVGYDTFSKDSKSKLRSLIQHFVLEGLKRSQIEADGAEAYATFALKINTHAYELFCTAHALASTLAYQQSHRNGQLEASCCCLAEVSTIHELRQRLQQTMSEISDLISQFTPECIQLAFDVAEAVAWAMHDTLAAPSMCLSQRSVRSLAEIRKQQIDMFLEHVSQSSSVVVEAKAETSTALSAQPSIVIPSLPLEQQHLIQKLQSTSTPDSSSRKGISPRIGSTPRSFNSNKSVGEPATDASSDINTAIAEAMPDLSIGDAAPWPSAISDVHSKEFEIIAKCMSTAPCAGEFAFPLATSKLPHFTQRRTSHEHICRGVGIVLSPTSSVRKERTSTCDATCHTMMCDNPEQDVDDDAMRPLIDRLLTSEATSNAAETLEQFLESRVDAISAVASKHFNPQCIQLLRKLVDATGLCQVIQDQPLLSGGEIEAKFPTVPILNDLQDEVRRLRAAIPWVTQADAFNHIQAVISEEIAPLSEKVKANLHKVPREFVRSRTPSFLVPSESPEVDGSSLAESLNKLEHGDASSHYVLGTRYLLGKGIQKDYVRGLHWTLQAASEGEAAAAYNAGLCFLHGIGCPVNFMLAAQWFEKASAADVYEALYELAKCKALGLGCQADTKGAFELLQKAATHGLPNAQYSLGKFLQEGLAVEPDPTTAIEWFLKSSHQSYVPAQYELGECYRFGRGVESDAKQAQEYYLLAAPTMSQAYTQLGGYCLQSLSADSGEKSDDTLRKAIEYFQRAARLGDSLSQLHLGQCYLMEQAVDGNLKRAYDWFSKAARQGCCKAQLEAARMCTRGQGTSVNLIQAFKWYLKAAEQDSAEGQYQLGMCYETGAGTPQDLKLASYWYQKAALQNHPQSQAKLVELNCSQNKSR